MDEQHVRQEMVRIGRLMHQFEFVDGASGNLSARLGPDRILVTPSGLPKGFLQPDQMVIVTPDGQPTSQQTPAARPLRPTSELPMHLEAYRKRPDVNAVVHAHPITAVALSIAGVSLAECVVPEAVVILGLVPTTPYANPASEENRRAIADLVSSHDALVLQAHGSLTLGVDLWDAYSKLETLEHTAKIIALARILGGAPALPPEQVVKLLSARQEAGYARPADPEDFCVHCGVCHRPGQHVDADALIQAVTAEVQRALSA